MLIITSKAPLIIKKSNILIHKNSSLNQQKFHFESQKRQPSRNMFKERFLMKGLIETYILYKRLVGLASLLI